MSLANSEDADEMVHNTAFHQGLRCLLIQKGSSEKEIYTILIGKYSLQSSNYTMNHSKFILSNQKDDNGINTYFITEDKMPQLNEKS